MFLIYLIQEGRRFSHEDYLVREGVFPVMVGYQLAEIFRLGEIYEFEVGGRSEIIQGKVVGVLAQGARYYELNSLSYEINLDYSYLFAQDHRDMSNLTFSDLDMAQTRMVVSGDEDTINKIFSQESPLNIKLINIHDKISYIISEEENILILSLGIAILFFGLALAISVFLFKRLVKKQMLEHKLQ